MPYFDFPFWVSHYYLICACLQITATLNIKCIDILLVNLKVECTKKKVYFAFNPNESHLQIIEITRPREKIKLKSCLRLLYLTVYSSTSTPGSVKPALVKRLPASRTYKINKKNPQDKKFDN